MSTQGTFLDIQQTLWNDALSYSMVAYWVVEFKRGRLDCKDVPLPRCEWPSTSVMEEYVKKVKKLVFEDRRITIKHLAEILKIYFGSTQSMSTDFNGIQKSVSTKKIRLELCMRNLEMFQRYPNQFCSRIVTMDERWLYHFDPETKRQSMFWKQPFSPTMKEIRVAWTPGKVISPVFEIMKELFLLITCRKDRRLLDPIMQI